MGTRAYYSYRYKGKYYKTYNHWDSYATGLGLDLVRSIPTDPDAFKEWLSSKRRQFEDGELDDTVEVGNRPPEHDLFIEWTYVIDLDLLEFVVDNNFFFRLEKLPRGPEDSDWIEYLQLDGSRDRCALPTTPKEILSNIHPSIKDLIPGRTLETYDSASPQILDSAAWTQTTSSRPVLCELSFFAFKNLVEDCYGLFSTLHQNRPDSSSFQIPAQFLLTVAAPGLLHITEQPAEDMMKYRLEPDIEYGQYAPMGGTGHWLFRNRSIFMASDLDNEESLMGWIGLVMEKIRKSRIGKSEHTALLWSARHAVAVVVSEAGVFHSRAIPVMDVFGVDDAAFTDGVYFLMHFLQLSFIKSGPVAAASYYPISCKTATGNDIARPYLPFDVISRILDYVDVRTYNSCSVLSKLYRINRAEHPRVGPYKLYKARSSSDKGAHDFELAVDALRCDDPATSSPQRMHLFHSRVASPSNDEEEQPGTPLFFQLRKYDRSVFGLHFFWPGYEFILATLAGCKRQRTNYYIVPTEDMARCNGTEAFKAERNSRCSYGRRRCPVELDR